MRPGWTDEFFVDKMKGQHGSGGKTDQRDPNQNVQSWDHHQRVSNDLVNAPGRLYTTRYVD